MNVLGTAEFNKTEIGQFYQAPPTPKINFPVLIKAFSNWREEHASDQPLEAAVIDFALSSLNRPLSQELVKGLISAYEQLPIEVDVLEKAGNMAGKSLKNMPGLRPEKVTYQTSHGPVTRTIYKRINQGTGQDMHQSPRPEGEHGQLHLTEVNHHRDLAPGDVIHYQPKGHDDHFEGKVHGVRELKQGSGRYVVDLIGHNGRRTTKQIGAGSAIHRVESKAPQGSGPAINHVARLQEHQVKLTSHDNKEGKLAHDPQVLKEFNEACSKHGVDMGSFFGGMKQLFDKAGLQLDMSQVSVQLHSEVKKAAKKDLNPGAYNRPMEYEYNRQTNPQLFAIQIPMPEGKHIEATVDTNFGKVSINRFEVPNGASRAFGKQLLGHMVTKLAARNSQKVILNPSSGGMSYAGMLAGFQPNMDYIRESLKAFFQPNKAKGEKTTYSNTPVHGRSEYDKLYEAHVVHSHPALAKTFTVPNDQGQPTKVFMGVDQVRALYKKFYPGGRLKTPSIGALLWKSPGKQDLTFKALMMHNQLSASDSGGRQVNQATHEISPLSRGLELDWSNPNQRSKFYRYIQKG